MRRFLIPGLVAVAAVAIIALLTFGVSSHADTASIDAKVARGAFPTAPGYRTALPLLGSSRKLDLADFRGKVVVMNVYASWCPPCHAEAPLLAREQRVLAKHGATFVGVTYEDNSVSTEQFDRQYGIHFPVLRDVSGSFVRSFGTFMVPETFVINRQGRIQALQRAPITQQWIDEHINPLLREKA